MAETSSYTPILKWQSDGTGLSAADVDDDSSGGSDIWGSIFDNLGDILTGGAAVVNAVNGKPTTVIQTAPGTYNPNLQKPFDMKILIYVFVAIVALVILFRFIK